MKITAEQYRQALAKPKKRNKYRNIETKVDGIKFKSKREAARYGVLKQLAKAGKIKNLKLQVPYSWNSTFEANGKRWRQKETYISDFVYEENGKTVVEDAKGFRTPMYRRKAKLMKKLYEIEILET